MIGNLLLVAESNDLIPFNRFELAFILLYLASLIVVGAISFLVRRKHSLRDFYLAGSGIGFVVLLLTLYATQYSGNTLLGFTGSTYRNGYWWAVSIHFMTAIVVFYLVFAPKLYRLSQRHRFITPTDYVYHRFQSKTLAVLCSVLMIVAIANFLVAQLMGMGRAFQGLTSADPEQAYLWGVIFLALIVVIYESIGGFRAVAWTDAIQGLVLMIGFLILLVMVFQKFGSIEHATRHLMDLDPAKTDPPDATRCATWASYILIVGMGAALYPQAIQRIYSAKKAIHLRRSLAVMVFLPLGTTTVSLLVGIMGAAYLPDLSQSDSVLTAICRQIQQDSTFGRLLVALLFAAILAALMSTADSVLLSLSSMFTKDLFARLVKPTASEATLTRAGKAFSWGVMVIAVILAIGLRHDANLVKLLDRKFDLLVQLVPAFLIGIHMQRMRAGPVTAGILAGCTVALTLWMSGYPKPLGIHAGLFGLAINVVISVGGSLMAKGSDAVPRSQPAA